MLIQLTLAYNCILAYEWDEYTSVPVRIAIEAGYYTLSELIPFIAVVIAFFYQIGIYREELGVDEPKADTGSTNASADEFRRFFVDCGIPIKEQEGRKSGSVIGEDHGLLSSGKDAEARCLNGDSQNMSIQEDKEIERIYRRASKGPISTEDATE